MGRLEARGFKYSDEAAIRRRIQAVTAEEVQKAAQMLTDDRSSTVIIMPETATPAPADYTALKSLKNNDKPFSDDLLLCDNAKR